MAAANGYNLPTVPRTPSPVGENVSVLTPTPNPNGTPDPNAVATATATDRSPSGQHNAFQLPDNLRIENLAADALFKHTARLALGAREAPALGGIPLLSKLGEGGMGSVYLGYHPRLRKEVAVKVLHAGPHDKTSIQRFCREAQLAAQVQSPHLVGVFDVNEEEGLFFIVMEFVHGLSAMDHMSHETELRLKATPHDERMTPGIKESEALAICAAACEGLAAAHDAGIVHRDIKPDNILIPKSRENGDLIFSAAKLADLGLARSERRGTRVTIASFGMGTPGFMAPEQAMNAAKAGKPADVYSLGSTLYALLAGRAPFEGDEPMALVVATVQDTPDPASKFRPDLKVCTQELLLRCLNKEPLRRPQDARALLRELRECQAEVSISTETKRAEVQLRAVNLPKRIVPAAKVDLRPNIVAPAAAPGLAVPVEPVSDAAATTALRPAVQVPAAPPALPAKPRSVLGAVGATLSWSVRAVKFARAIGRARGAVKIKDWNEAIASFKYALEHSDTDAKKNEARAGLEDAEYQKRLAEAQLAFQKGNWDAALASYQYAINMRPQDPRAKVALEKAQTHRTETEFATLLKEAEGALKDEEKDSDGHFAAMPVAKHQRLEKAVHRALTLKPQDFRALQLRTQLGDARELSLDIGGDNAIAVLRCKPGEFEMGSGDGGATERPARKVKLSRPYYVGRTPVTLAQFRRFVETTNYVTDAEKAGAGWTLKSSRWMYIKGVNWRQPGFSQSDTHPVVLVSWNDALAFASWATKNARIDAADRQAGLTVVLPTEAQWEFAARSTKSLRYPWGQMWEASRANHADLCLKNVGFDEFCSSDNDGYSFTSPVGVIENESWCGAYDMSGNVWQWCHDWYGDVYYRSAENLDPTGPAQGTLRSLRGGSWLDMPLKCRSFSRRGEASGMAAANIGFRVAVSWRG